MANSLPAYVTDEGRLSALYRYDILDTPPEEPFERVVRLAAHIFNAPVSTISLVEDRRIWFKARYGLDATEIQCLPGLCTDTVCMGKINIITDPCSDPRTAAHPLVAGAFGLRFYAGAPLTTYDGFRLGTICVIDTKPRPPLSPEQEAALHDLAGVIMDQLELRLAARKTIESLTFAKLDTEKLENPDSLITLCAWSKKVKLDGEWVTFEEFLARRFGAQVTHGITREAMRQALQEWKNRTAARSAQAAAAD